MQVDYAAMRGVFEETGYQLAYYSPIGLLYCMVKSRDRLKAYPLGRGVVIEGDDGIEFVYLPAAGGMEKLDKMTPGKPVSYIDMRCRHLFDNLKPSRQEHHEVVYDIRRFTDFSEIPGKARLSRRFSENYGGIRFGHAHGIDGALMSAIRKLFATWYHKTSHGSSYEIESIERIQRLQYFPKIDVYSLYDKNEMIAYCIGDRGNNGMFLLHFIKCDTRYRGIYQYFHQKIGCHQRDAYGACCINYTNLTNNIGLREMKLQLKPSFYLEPFCSLQCRCCEA